MSQTEQKLNEAFTDGIWRDMHNGNFTSIEESDAGGVRLCIPESGVCYHTIPLQEWKNGERNDFSKVPAGAVSDPELYVQDAIDIIVRNDIDELSRLNQHFANGVSYAKEQIEVSAL